MPSRCIFFFSALRAWSTLLSRTRTCTRRISFSIRSAKCGCAEGQGGLPSRAPIAECKPKVYQGCGFLAVFSRRRPAALGEGGSRDDVRRELILDLNDKVAQLQLALLQALHLEEIGPRGV